MSSQTVNKWAQKAKGEELVSVEADGTLVVQPVDLKNKGQAIMKISEKLFLWYREYFKDQRDKNGMLIAPARIRALALNMAQSIVSEQELAAE